MSSSNDPSAIQLPCLAVAMIVRNAEKTLPATLESIRPLADIIVVADTGSTDSTVEVAKKYTPNVISVDWQQSFSAARNACLDKVRSQWVLWIDTGESIASEDASSMRQFVELQADPQTAYRMMIREKRSPNTIMPEQVARIRLVPNQPGIRFSGRVREDLTPTLEARGLSVDTIPWRIHRTVDQKAAALLNRARRDLELAELEIQERGAHARALNCLGEALQALDEHARAGECFRHAIKNAARGSVDMLESYYGLLTSLDGDPRSIEAQLAVCLDALEIFPLDMQLLCAMGGYLQAQNRLDLAARSYETAYRLGQIVPETWHLEELREVSAACFCLSSPEPDREQSVQAFLEEALQEHPQSAHLRSLAIEWYGKRNQRDTAMRHADRLPTNTPHRDTIPAVVDGICLAASQQWQPAAAILESAFEAGNRGVLCLRWLVSIHIARSDLQRAEQILAKWKQLEPNNLEVDRHLSDLQKLRSDKVPPDTPSISPSKTQPPNQDGTIAPGTNQPQRIPEHRALGSIPAPPPVHRTNPVRIDYGETTRPSKPISAPHTSRQTESSS